MMDALLLRGRLDASAGLPVGLAGTGTIKTFEADFVKRGEIPTFDFRSIALSDPRWKLL